MKLPGCSGDEIVKSIRQASQQTRMVIVTGFAEEMKSRIETALAAGPSAVFHKPIEAESLLATVEELVACR
jgi:CheY-like chemotaxis protein